MNLKFVVVSIGIFLALLSNGIDNTKNEEIIEKNEKNIYQNELNIVTQNEIQLKEIQDESAGITENIVDIVDAEDNNEIEKSNVTVTLRNAEEKNRKDIEDKKEENKDIEKITKVNEQKVIVQNTEITQNDNRKQNNNKQEIIEEQKTNAIQPESKPKELTPEDLEYWCVAGGSHHVAGDGENEHGYYNTWDEAYNAFLNHTAAWSSSQYKVSCCSCGLYYFWAIQ